MILAPLPPCLHLCVALAALAFTAAARQSPTTQPSPPPPPSLSVEDEVRSNILAQPIGRHRVADLHIPDELLRRITDRIIRSSFEERHRIVVRDRAARTSDGDQPATQPAAPIIEVNEAIEVREMPTPPGGFERWQTWALTPDQRPSNRGFIPNLIAADVADWPLHEPPDSADARVRAAADIVATRLAVDGLLSTTLRVVEALGTESLLRVDERDLTTLRATGLPIDLLNHFLLPGGGTGPAIIPRFAMALHTGVSRETLRDQIAQAAFRFKPTAAGFTLATESGEHDAVIIRAHMTRGGYWKGIGDGGNADLLRQAATAFPNARIVINTEQRFAGDFARCVQTWPQDARSRIAIASQPISLAQWAQDNGKPGWIERDGQRRAAMLVPRYASRNEDGSVFAPGDALGTLTTTTLDHELVHSPLLFQGGSILAVRDPKSGEGGGRLLLIGEAEIARNTALGLTADQALEAFRVECAADRAVALPAVSFHLDYDVSIRASGDELVALVNDPWPAARLILREATNTLLRTGLIDQTIATQTIDALQREDDHAVLETFGAQIFATSANGTGAFPLSLAEHLSTSPVDSGVGNLQRVLLALDLLASRTLRDNELPPDRHARSYLQSLQRLEQDRLALHQQLRDLGMRVVAIPSISHDRRSVTAINGIHLQDRYLMPANGGLFAALDEAAAQAIREALGKNIEVIPILCGESQRRSGALHCSLSIFPTLAE